MKIDNSKVVSTGWRHKDRLRVATEVHWRGLPQQTFSEKRRLHAVLSVLPTLANIRILSLYNADISEAQQAIIFGISTLRTLVVHSCEFQPSTKPLPLSRVNTLNFTGVKAIGHLLTLLATTVESLEITGDDDPIGPALQNVLIELPKLSSFTMKCQGHVLSRPISDTFKRYNSITTICIIFDKCYMGVSFDHLDLPALCSVTCNYLFAMLLVPQRPVTTYVEVRFLQARHLATLLNTLSKTCAQITNLKLFVSGRFYKLTPSLAASLQHLEQLTLRDLDDHERWFEPYARLSGWSPLHPLGVLPKLKWVTYWVANYISADFPLEGVIRTWVTPVCPALEVFECLSFTVDTPDFVTGWPAEPIRVWKVQKLPDGSWERQGPPPIPTPVPANKTL